MPENAPAAAARPLGPISRARASLEAIRTLLRLREDRGTPTVDDLAALREWSGWGPLAPALSETRSGSWAEIGEELQRLLPPRDYRQAEQGTSTAYYTPDVIVQECWTALRDLNFPGGSIFEPGCGAGSFISQTPDGMPVQWYGVERDPTTAGIAALLHPDAVITNARLQDAGLQTNSVDAVLGNVPYGNFPVHDKTAPKAVTESIHNYFIWRSVQALRPGGVAILLTSRYTMDAADEEGRRAIARHADLLGAVRLPTGALAEGGTEVVADLLVLRRRDTNGPMDTSWMETSKIPEVPGQLANNYFLDHPEHVLGTLQEGRAPQYGITLAVKPPEGQDLATALGTALNAITAAAREADRDWRVAVGAQPFTADALPFPVREDGRQEGSFHLVDGKPHEVVDGELVAVERAGKELPKLIALRDAAVKLIEAETNHDTPDVQLDPLRAEVNRLYDAYVQKHGPINRYTLAEGQVDEETGEKAISRRYPRLGGFRRDPDIVAVLALEDFNDETQTADKAPLLTRRVNRRIERPTSAQTPEEALSLCLNFKNKIDVPTIAQLLGIEEEQVPGALGELVFPDPDNGELLTRGTYLSGPVVDKLERAEFLLSQGRDDLQRHVDALREVQPEPLPPEDIKAKLGAPWIPVDDVKTFAEELLGVDVDILHVPRTATWSVDQPMTMPEAATSEWGTSRVNAFELLDLALNGQAPKVYDTFLNPDGGSRRVRNDKETMLAESKLMALTRRFASWVWEDPDRADRLAADYNRIFNATVLPKHDGSHLTVDGIDPDFKPYTHQWDFVQRVLSAEEGALCPYPVGAGKTATMFMTAAKLKQLGLVSKPLIIVPNHLLEQIARDGKKLFPNARILMAGKKDLADARSRMLFAARCATGDWDTIVMTHNSFGRLGVHPVTEATYLEELANEYRIALSTLDTDDRKDRRIKEIAKMVDRFDARASDLRSKATDAGVTYENLGIDFLQVDEAHKFKNLALPATTEGMSLGKPSKRATDLDLKLILTRERTGRDNVTALYSGTFIDNSVREMYVFQHYAMPKRLAKLGLGSPDAWAANFIHFESRPEVGVDGVSFRLKRRPVEYTNADEALALFAEVAELRPPEEFKIKRPRRVDRFVEIDATPNLVRYVGSISHRIDEIQTGKVKPFEDNMLNVITDGRKAALDLELVGMLPDGPGKAGAIVQNVLEIHERTKDLKLPGDPDDVSGGLQLIFCDLGTPSKKRGSQVYGKIRKGLVEGMPELGLPGIPRDRIRFIHDYNSDLAKEQLFSDARAGKVSVLFMSSEKGGTGVNVQTRGVALHHADPPHKPAEWEQREGRLHRPGNRLIDLDMPVEFLRYIALNSFDSYMFQQLERKQRPIVQIMSGRKVGRVIQEIDPVGASFGQAKAVATGNPMLLELADVNGQLTMLLNEADGHRQSQARMQRKTEVLTDEIKEAEQTLPAMRAMADAITAAGDDDTWRTADGRVIDPDDVAGVLAQTAQASKPTLDLDAGYRWRGMSVGFTWHRGRQFGTVAYESYAHLVAGGHQVEVRLNLSWFGKGQSWRITKALSEAAEAAVNAPAEIERKTAKQRAALEDTRSHIGRPFGKHAELEAARQRKAALEDQISGAAVDSGRESGSGPQFDPGAAAGEDEMSRADMAMHDAAAMAGGLGGTAVVVTDHSDIDLRTPDLADLGQYQEALRALIVDAAADEGLTAQAQAAGANYGASGFRAAVAEWAQDWALERANLPEDRPAWLRGWLEPESADTRQMLIGEAAWIIWQQARATEPDQVPPAPQDALAPEPKPGPAPEESAAPPAPPQPGPQEPALATTPPQETAQLPEDAAPVPGAEGYHYIEEVRTVRLYTEAGDEVGTAKWSHSKYRYLGDVQGDTVRGTEDGATVAKRMANHHAVVYGDRVHRPTVDGQGRDPVWILHNGSDTLVFGVSPEDDTAKAAMWTGGGFKESRKVGGWYLPRSWKEPTRRQRVDDAVRVLAAAGRTVTVHTSRAERQEPPQRPVRLPELVVTAPELDEVPQLFDAEPFTAQDGLADVQALETAYARWGRHPTVRAYLQQDSDARPNGFGTPDNPIAELHIAYHRARLALREPVPGGPQEIVRRVYNMAAWCQELEAVVDDDLLDPLQDVYKAAHLLAARSQATAALAAERPSANNAPEPAPKREAPPAAQQEPGGHDPAAATEEQVQQSPEPAPGLADAEQQTTKTDPTAQQTPPKPDPAPSATPGTSGTRSAPAGDGEKAEGAVPRESEQVPAADGYYFTGDENGTVHLYTAGEGLVGTARWSSIQDRYVADVQGETFPGAEDAATTAKRMASYHAVVHGGDVRQPDSEAQKPQGLVVDDAFAVLYTASLGGVGAHQTSQGAWDTSTLPIGYEADAVHGPFADPELVTRLEAEGLVEYGPLMILRTTPAGRERITALTPDREKSAQLPAVGDRVLLLEQAEVGIVCERRTTGGSRWVDVVRASEKSPRSLPVSPTYLTLLEPAAVTPEEAAELYRESAMKDLAETALDEDRVTQWAQANDQDTFTRRFTSWLLETVVDQWAQVPPDQHPQWVTELFQTTPGAEAARADFCARTAQRVYERTPGAKSPMAPPTEPPPRDSPADHVDKAAPPASLPELQAPGPAAAATGGESAPSNHEQLPAREPEVPEVSRAMPEGTVAVPGADGYRYVTERNASRTIYLYTDDEDLVGTARRAHARARYVADVQGDTVPGATQTLTTVQLMAEHHAVVHGTQVHRPDGDAQGRDPVWVFHSASDTLVHGVEPDDRTALAALRAARFSEVHTIGAWHLLDLHTGTTRQDCVDTFVRIMAAAGRPVEIHADRAARARTAAPDTLPELTVAAPNLERVPQLEDAPPYADNADARQDIDQLAAAWQRWSEQPLVAAYHEQDRQARPDGKGPARNPITELRLAHERAEQALGSPGLAGRDEIVRRVYEVTAWCQALESAVPDVLLSSLRDVQQAALVLTSRAQSTSAVGSTVEADSANETDQQPSDAELNTMSPQPDGELEGATQPVSAQPSIVGASPANGRTEQIDLFEFEPAEGAGQSTSEEAIRKKAPAVLQPGRADEPAGTGPEPPRDIGNDAQAVEPAYAMGDKVVYLDGLEHTVLEVSEDGTTLRVPGGIELAAREVTRARDMPPVTTDKLADGWWKITYRDRTYIAARLPDDLTRGRLSTLATIVTDEDGELVGRDFGAPSDKRIIWAYHHPGVLHPDVTAWWRVGGNRSPLPGYTAAEQAFVAAGPPRTLTALDPPEPGQTTAAAQTAAAPSGKPEAPGRPPLNDQQASAEKLPGQHTLQSPESEEPVSQTEAPVPAPPQTEPAPPAVEIEDPPAPRRYTETTSVPLDPAYSLRLYGTDGQTPDSGEVRHHDQVIAVMTPASGETWDARLTAPGLPQDATSADPPAIAAQRAAILYSSYTGTPYGPPPAAAEGTGPEDRGQVLRAELRDYARSHQGVLVAAAGRVPPAARSVAGPGTVLGDLDAMAQAVAGNHDATEMAANLAAVRASATSLRDALVRGTTEARRELSYPLAHLIYDTTRFQERLRATVDLARQEAPKAARDDVAPDLARSQSHLSDYQAGLPPRDEAAAAAYREWQKLDGDYYDDALAARDAEEQAERRDAHADMVSDRRKKAQSQRSAPAPRAPKAAADAEPGSPAPQNIGPASTEAPTQPKETAPTASAHAHREARAAAVTAAWKNVEQAWRETVAPQGPPEAVRERLDVLRGYVTAAPAPLSMPASSSVQQGDTTWPQAMEQAEAIAGVADTPEWSAVDKIRQALRDLRDALREAAGDAWDRLRTRMSDGWRSLTATALESVAGWAQQGADRLRGVGKDLPTAQALLDLGDTALRYSVPPPSDPPPAPTEAASATPQPAPDPLDRLRQFAGGAPAPAVSASAARSRSNGRRPAHPPRTQPSAPAQAARQPVTEQRPARTR